MIITKIAYYNNGKFIELKATVVENKLSAYFDYIRNNVNFENYYQYSKSFTSVLRRHIIYESRLESSIKTTSEVINELGLISKSDVMNFSIILDILKSKNMINNHKLIIELRNFMKLYQYNLVLEYKDEDVNKVLRNIMQKGSDIDSLEATKLVSSARANTEYLDIISMPNLNDKKILTYKPNDSRM